MKPVSAHEIDNEYVKRTSYSWGLIQPVFVIQMYIIVVKMIANLIPSLHETKWDGSMAYINGMVELGEELMRQQGISLRTYQNHGGLQPSGIQEDGCDSDTLHRRKESNSRSTSTAPSSRSSESAFWDSERGSQEASIQQTFIAAHGVVTLLYMVCTRCRDPMIRRRALRILQTCNRKEGIWDSAQSALVAERVIQIEETAADGLVTDASHIPSQARIQQLETSFQSGKPGKRIYAMNGATSPLTAVEHLSDNNGQANWEVREEAMKSRSFY